MRGPLYNVVKALQAIHDNFEEALQFGFVANQTNGRAKHKLAFQGMS
jgi:hypothetical protein